MLFFQNVIYYNFVCLCSLYMECAYYDDRLLFPEYFHCRLMKIVFSLTEWNLTKVSSTQNTFSLVSVKTI